MFRIMCNIVSAAAQVALPILAAGLFSVVFTHDRSKQRRLELIMARVDVLGPNSF